jgi:uncharacterized membrane protein YdjX (TVP38/TMEM64 family)
MNPKARLKLLRVLLVLVFVGVTGFVALNPQAVSIVRFRGLGYLGAFLMAFVGSTTVILPIPHLAFTFTMGSLLTPWIIGLCAGTGDALGELWGYLAGYAVEDMVEGWKFYPTIEGWMRERGELTVFLMGVVPMPLFDLAGIAGGATGFPVWRFFLATWLGKTIKAIVFAWGGFYGLSWIANLLGLG